MTSTKITRIGGSTVCPVALLTGKVGGDYINGDGDSMRAGFLSDGRIENIYNGFSHPLPEDFKARILAQPEGIRVLVASLISSTNLEDETLRLTFVGHQLDGRDITDVSTQLAAHDVDASALDNTAIALNAGTCLQTLRITYDGHVETALAATAVGADAKGVLTGVEMKHAPACITLAADKLIEAGFRTVGANFDGASLRTITFTKGDGSHLIRAELTWIV